MSEGRYHQLFATGGLVARGGPLRTFELAGSDGRFEPAEAQIDGDCVVVRSASVANLPRLDMDGRIIHGIATCSMPPACPLRLSAPTADLRKMHGECSK